MNTYSKIYTSFILKEAFIGKKLRIVIDCSNGPSGKVLEGLKSQKLQIIFINNKMDSDFPAHGPNPLVQNALDDLKKAVIKNKADFGAILDGDGDRVIFCDNLGERVETDAIMRLLINKLNAKKIILDPRNGYLITKYAEQKDIETVESKVGRYFIQKAMRTEKADLAAETAGHYHFSFKIKGNFYYFDSAAKAIIQVASAISQMPYKLADFVNLLPKYNRIKEMNFIIPNKDACFKKIENYFRGKAKRISRLDGLKMEFSDKIGNLWFNIRPSANDPVIRLNMESDSNKMLKKYLAEVKKLIASAK